MDNGVLFSFPPSPQQKEPLPRNQFLAEVAANDNLSPELKTWFLEMESEYFSLDGKNIYDYAVHGDGNYNVGFSFTVLRVEDKNILKAMSAASKKRDFFVYMNSERITIVLSFDSVPKNKTQLKVFAYWVIESSTAKRLTTINFLRTYTISITLQFCRMMKFITLHLMLDHIL